MTRYLAAACLKWVPKVTAEPVLMKLQSLDQDAPVREQAGKSLGVIR